MKKALFTFSMAMFAGLASAQIWSESFDTNAPPTLTTDSYAQITNEYTTGQWTTVGGTVGTNGHLRLVVDNWAGQKGMPWGTSIALDDSLFTAADTYRVTLDVSAIQADGTLGVRIYDASSGSAGTNNYYEIANYQYGLMNPVKVIPFGDATTNLLAEVYYNSSHAGIRSVDFDYDGSGDVVVVLMAMSVTSSTPFWLQSSSTQLRLAR